MATFHIEHFGCRATQADAAAIERQLLERGYARAAAAHAADVVVVNTCTVTRDADAAARQAIRHTHRENPGARILVTGCYAQRAPEELAQLSGVSWVVGNSHQPEIPSLVAQAFLPGSSCDLVQIQNSQSRMAVPTKVLTGDVFAQADLPVAPVMGGEGDHTRPILKVQDGCNSRCSYCVIPFVRGRSRSLPPARVVEEIRRLAAGSYKEVVLSGINLGSYGRDLTPRVELDGLLRRILDETPLARLRVSSIEPMDITQDLVDLFASTDRIARHFHVPLQSGSDRILAAMHRWYRAAHYARRIELIRERLPEAAIGADVIVGFPGETDNDHRATVALVEQLPFTYLHVFAYSERPDTKAARLSGEVPPAVIKERSRELRALAAAKGAAFRAAQVGRTLRVLTLKKRHAGETASLSDNYLKIRIPGIWPPNRFLDVRVAADGGSHLV
jgi:threonylcarbamoyladenosine tRNA methylthiotransferase MtaB